jgi:hypothetical protein
VETLNRGEKLRKTTSDIYSQKVKKRIITNTENKIKFAEKEGITTNGPTVITQSNTERSENK